MLLQHKQRIGIESLLPQKLRHEHRTTCSLGHYLQSDYAGAVTGEKLIDDVMRQGFLHGIAIEADDGALVLSARVSETKKGEPETIPCCGCAARMCRCGNFFTPAGSTFLLKTRGAKCGRAAACRRKFIAGS